MALRYYRNGPARQLAFPIAAPGDTSCTVDSASGFPTQFPYTLIIDPDTALEEVVDVTAAVGNVLTITRGVDSTTASAHATGVAVYHGVSARDPREANTHVNATTGVHGITGSIVDTDSVQTIVGAKNFTGGLTTPAGAVVAVGGVQTITGRKVFDDAESTAGGDFVAVGGIQTITGAKTFSGNQTFNGNNVNTGTESHSGVNTFTGAVTVGGLNVYPPEWKVATGDIPTPLSAAWGNVTGFSFTAVAGAVYAIDSVMFLENPSSSTVDIRFGYTFPVGRMSAFQAGLDTSVVAPAYNGTNTAHAVIGFTPSPLDEGTGIGTPASIQVGARLAATFFCTTGGTVQLRLRQDTSDAAFTTRVKDGSRMCIQRIS